MIGTRTCAVTLLVFCLSSACTSDPSEETGVDRADSSPAISPDSAARDELATAPESPAAAGESEPDSIAWTEEPIRVRRTIPDAAVVTAIRAGEHEDFDRFVVEFQNDAVPGYQVMYLNGDAHECGSGGLIDLLGTERLEVRLEPARGYDEEGRSTVDHAQRDFHLKVLEEAEISCDFETVFAVVLGTAGERPFRISESENPARLVVDIRHEGERSRHSLIHRKRGLGMDGLHGPRSRCRTRRRRATAMRLETGARRYGCSSLRDTDFHIRESWEAARIERNSTYLPPIDSSKTRAEGHG